MSLSSSTLAYPDIRDILAKALESPNGLKLTFDSPGQAVYFRQRAYRYRNLLQKENRQVYPLGDPMHGRSPYDGFVIRIIDFGVVHITPMTLEGVKMEEL